MGEPLAEDAFDVLFDTFERSLFRMETRPSYAVSYERDVFEAFLAGGPLSNPPEIDWWRPWLDWVAGQVAAGRSLRRVRLLDDPPTDYQRFSLWGGDWNSDAGEAIRYLPRSAAAAAGIPDGRDWWMFDDDKVVTLDYDVSGEVVAQELESDPVVVARYRAWRDLAFTEARPVANRWTTEEGRRRGLA